MHRKNIHALQRNTMLYMLKLLREQVHPPRQWPALSKSFANIKYLSTVQKNVPSGKMWLNCCKALIPCRTNWKETIKRTPVLTSDELKDLQCAKVRGIIKVTLADMLQYFGNPASNVEACVKHVTWRCHMKMHRQADLFYMCWQQMVTMSKQWPWNLAMDNVQNPCINKSLSKE